MDAFNILLSVTLRFFYYTDRHISNIYMYIYVCVNGVDVIVKNCIPTFIKLFSITGLRKICEPRRNEVTKY